MKKILVVDDSATVREQVGQVLVSAGFEVVQAVDGIDGLDKADASIALVICDVNMPRMNGLEMLERLSAENRLAKMPVVMLTTEGHPQLVQRAKKAGAKAWMLKPFKPELMVATIQKMVA